MKKPPKPKPPAPAPDFPPACRKLGKAVRFTFLREIRHAMKCDENEAGKLFEKAIKNGDIVEVGSNPAGDVKYFQGK